MGDLGAGFCRGRARVGRTEETIRGRARARCDYFTKKNQGDAECNSRKSWGGTYVGCLAQPTSRFILSIRVAVGGDLEEKEEGEKGQRKRKRPCESAPIQDGITIHRFAVPYSRPLAGINLHGQASPFISVS